jgi:hypothetical protein
MGRPVISMNHVSRPKLRVCLTKSKLTNPNVALLHHTEYCIVGDYRISHPNESPSSINFLTTQRSYSVFYKTEFAEVGIRCPLLLYDAGHATLAPRPLYSWHCYLCILLSCYYRLRLAGGTTEAIIASNGRIGS